MQRQFDVRSAMTVETFEILGWMAECNPCSLFRDSSSDFVTVDATRSSRIVFGRLHGGSRLRGVIESAYLSSQSQYSIVPRHFAILISA